MAYDDEIRPAARTQFGGGHGGTHVPGGRRADQAESTPPPRRRLDEVELTEPHRVALRLLRSRVLELTRERLELTRATEPHIEFAPSLGRQADVFVGRLLSDQNLMAAGRRQEWPAERLAQALEDGMTDGLAETLEVLDEVGKLDAETWGLVCGVLEAFQRKVMAAGG